MRNISRSWKWRRLSNFEINEATKSKKRNLLKSQNAGQNNALYGLCNSDLHLISALPAQWRWVTPMANAGRSAVYKRAIPAGRGGLVDGLIPETRMARNRSCPPSASSRCWNALCFPASRRRRRFHRVSHQRGAHRQTRLITNAFVIST